MKYDFLIVGTGYSGCILAQRIAEELNKKILLVEKRSHIAGNAYDYYNEDGILVHKYGPHIFHTQNKKAWEYLSRFTRWRPYYHRVLAVVEGMTMPVPFNFNSLYKAFPPKYAEKLERTLLENYGYGLKIPILKLLETKNDDLKLLADYIYKNIFLGYTIKQWGLKPDELDYSVTSRIPVYLSRDDRYFQDQYQGIPEHGYTAMLNKIITHRNIHLMLNTDYKDVIGDIKFDRIIYTGPIDYFFDLVHGELPYRSLNFDFKTYDTDIFQEVAQVNYPNNHKFTRITEFKHLSGQTHRKTTVAYEYPSQYQKGINEPYYPIPKDENHEQFAKYKADADKLNNAYFTGRLAEYKYYNMDQVVGTSMIIFRKIVEDLR